MSLFKRKDDQIGRLQEAIVTKARQIRQLKRCALDEKQRLDQHLKELQEAIEAAYLRIERALDQDPQKPVLIRKQLPTRMDPCPRIGEHLLLLRMITARQLMNSLREQKRSGGILGEIMVRLGYVARDRLQSVIDQSGRRPLIGELLVRSGHVKRKDLDRALAEQESAGGMLGDMLLSMNLISPAQLADVLAVQGRMKRLTGYDRHEVIRSKLPEKAARKFRAVVISQSAGQCVVAAEAALSETQIHELSQMVESPVAQVLASSQEMERLWTLAYASEWLSESTEKLKTEQPENSASQTFSRAQIIWMMIIWMMIAGSMVWNWFYTLVLLNVIIQLIYVAMTVTKFVIILHGTKEKAQIRFSDQDVQSMDERTLPVYSILVPMYKESKVIPQLVRNLNQLDYPKNKLDIRLLIEQDDVEAQSVIQSLHLPGYFQMIVIPDGQPKTKPKACNYGLIRARGEYIVIYDAEDRPDPDQLKKACLAFRQSPDNTACIQAKLNYFNSQQNLLTRFFTQEYSHWFELLLPGIMQLNIPIPLGGTSNHFKTDVLRKLGAWDPYNVTEDADLGIRLYKENYITKVLDSRTLEEANSQFRNWINQRSRWIKGYMQTWLVHMRHPIRLHHDLGIKGFWGAQFMLLSSPLLPLLNPVFWSLLLLWHATHAGWITAFFPGFIYYLAAAQLLLGNFLFIYTNIAGTYWVVHDLHRRNETWLSYSLVRYALLTPFYWAMMSIASFKALWQLIRKPFYWEKTEHGFDQERFDTTKSTRVSERG